MLDKILGENPDVRRLQSSTARSLARIGISANLATLVALAAGIGAAIAFAARSPGSGILLLAISGALDALDGALARGRGFLGAALLLAGDRQLQHGGALARHQPGHHHDLATREFERVVMHMRVIHVDLAESGNFVLDASLAEQAEGAVVLDIVLERTEALIFFVVLGAIESGPFLRSMGPMLCYAMAALEVATAAQRFQFGWRMLKSQ